MRRLGEGPHHCELCGLKSVTRHNSEAECISFLKSRLRLAESAAEKRLNLVRSQEKRIESWKAKCNAAQEALKSAHSQTAYERAHEERLSVVETFIEGLRAGREIQ